MMTAGKGGKLALGDAMILFGLLVLSGADKIVQSQLIQLSPHWLTNLTAQY